MLTNGSRRATSRSSGVTLKTGKSPHGWSSYASGNERANSRMRSARTSPFMRSFSLVSRFRRPGTRRAPEPEPTGGIPMAQSVRELMTSNPCSIDTEKSVAYAAKMLREENVGLAPIVEGDRLVGTVTDRDIAIRVVAEGKDPEAIKVAEIASTDLVTVDPQEDLDEALRLMAKHQV